MKVNPIQGIGLLKDAIRFDGCISQTLTSQCKWHKGLDSKEESDLNDHRCD